MNDDCYAMSWKSPVTCMGLDDILLHNAIPDLDLKYCFA